MITLLYISQLAEPELHDLSVYVGQADGEDDVAWFRTRLRELELDDQVALTAVRVCLGEPLPDPSGFDAVVIGGSYHMVSEEREWQQRMLGWFDHARASGRPMFGICGGHQLMAAYHGAAVVPMTEGPWSGTRAVEPTENGRDHWLFQNVGEAVGYHFGNTEHVIPPPANAEVLARTPTSPALALDYGDDWVSVQFHPEMSVDTFACYWETIDPTRVASYTPSPTARLLIRNFNEQVQAAVARCAI